MNVDIFPPSEDGLDLGTAQSAVAKAGNVLSIQLGALEYAPEFGIDMKYFLESPFRFQNESFRAYAVEILTKNQINVVEVIQVIETLFTGLTFYVDDQSNVTEGLIQ